MHSITVTIGLPGTRSRWLAAGLGIGLLVAIVGGPAVMPRSTFAVDPADPIEHTISVSGTGRIVVSPDIADLRLGVSITKPTVKAARASAAAAMTKVLAALGKLGIADADVQTSTLSLQPNYNYAKNTNTPRITGYTLSNSVAVTVRDLDKIGDAIDGTLAAGATTLDGVSFRVDDPVRAEAQARAEAMAEAKAKADTLASSAGISVGGVASISETAGPMPYPVYYGAARLGAIAADAATPVQVGTNEVSVTVAVVYLIR